MANIRQWQRGAFEELRSYSRHKFPFRLDPGVERVFFNLDRRGIHLVYLGISKGIGTCASIQGVDVAVFGTCKKRRKPVPLEVIFSELSGAEYPVLLHQGTVPDLLGCPRKTVELLEFTGMRIQGGIVKISLKRTLQTTNYVVTI